MLDRNDTTDAPGPEALDGASRPPANRRTLLLLALATIALIGTALAVLFALVDQRERELVRNVETRLQIVADGRAEVAATWLSGRAELGRRLTENHLFRLFAAELEMSGEGAQISEELSQQLPYMQAVITDFAAQNGLTGVYMVGPSGRAYLSSADAPRLAQEQRGAVKSGGDEPVGFLPLRTAGQSLLLDIVLPVAAPQSLPGEEPATAGYLLMSVPAGERLRDLLAAGPLTAPGEHTRLVQANPDGTLVEVRPQKPDPLVTLEGIPAPEQLGFDRRPALDGDREVFSTTSRVPQLPWWVVQEYEVTAAVAPLETFRTAGIVVTSLFALLVAAALVALWWWQKSEKSRALADQYREMAAEIQAQQRLLESINQSITEQISLKDRDGRYIYVNPAFERGVGYTRESVLGKTDDLVYDSDVARRLQALDERTLRGEEVLNVQLPMRLEGRWRYFQISKTGIKDRDWHSIGVVTVARDVTESILHQRERERTIRQTVAALDHTIALADPYLRGHSTKVKELATGVVRLLGGNRPLLSTLEIASDLCQIGKLSIPSDILASPERLTDEEMAVMRRHIDYALEVLKHIDFRLPVAMVVSEMHERLDGSGYPAGKKGREISLGGRILAVCDYFVARTSPRSYRDPAHPASVLSALASQPDKFDRRVVAALEKLIRSQAGRATRVLTGAAAHDQ